MPADVSGALFGVQCNDVVVSSRVRHWNGGNFVGILSRGLKTDVGNAQLMQKSMGTLPLLMVAAVYAALALALDLSAVPFRLRDFFEWLFQLPARARVLAATYFGFLVERMTREKPLTGPERQDFIDSAVVLLDAIVRP